nr:hypothetical protein [Tanacetum cinerariifolium]
MILLTNHEKNNIFGGKQLEQKPVVARGNFCYTDLSEWFIPYTYSPCMDYPNSLPDVVLIPDKTPDDYSAIPSTYSPLNPEWFKVLEEKLNDYANSNPGLSS